MIEKYYTWVDVQFLIFSQFPSLFNVSRNCILSFVSYNLIYVATCFIASSSILIVQYAHEHNVYCMFKNHCFVCMCIIYILKESFNAHSKHFATKANKVKSIHFVVVKQTFNIIHIMCEHFTTIPRVLCVGETTNI